MSLDGEDQCEEMEEDPESYGSSNPSPDEAAASQPARSNKRKRENDSFRTPSRPKSARTSSAKRISDVTSEERWYAEQAQNAPVPLPLSLVSLFRRPHVFPSPNYDEILKNFGVRPQLFYKTATNSTSFADHLNRTPDVIVKRLRARQSRTSLDDEFDRQRAERGTTSDVPSEVPVVEQKPDGSYVVLRKDCPAARFPRITVSVTTLSDSVVRLKTNDNSDSNETSFSE